MSLGDKEVREKLLAWALQNENSGSNNLDEGVSSIGKGNLAIIGGISLAAILGVAYYSMESTPTIESELNINAEEIEVEEEYLLVEEEEED